MGNLSSTDIYRKAMKRLENIEFQPEHVQVFPTNRCNINCIFCWRHRAENIEEEKVSDEKLLELVREACSFRPGIISISGGGEPLLKKNFLMEAMKEIGQYKDITTEVITNGTLFDEELVEAMIDNRMECIRLSLNAPSAEKEDFLTGRKETFRKQIESLEMIKRIKKERSSRLPEIDLSMVITKHNFKQISEMVYLADRYDASLQVRTVIEPYGGERKFSVPHERKGELLEELEKAEKLSKNLGLEFQTDFKKEDLMESKNCEADGTELPSHQKKKSIEDEKSVKEMFEALKNKNQEKLLSEYAACELPFLEISIFSDGYAVPCAGAFFTGNQDTDKISEYIESVFGSSFSESWNSKAFNHMRTLSLFQSLPDPCKNCNENFVKQSENLRKELLGEK